MTVRTKTVSAEVERKIEAFGVAHAQQSVSSTIECIADTLSLLNSYIGETTAVTEGANNWHDDRRAVRTINVGD